MKESTRERFDRQVRELGGEPAYEVWQGTHKPHKVVCAEGHECKPRPDSVQRGNGICPTCANKKITRPAAVQAEKDYIARVEALGGTCKHETWEGVSKPHRVICRAGHECKPRPSSVQQGQGLCRTCGDAAINRAAAVQAEKDYIARVEAFGGTCAHEVWEGTQKPHAVICKAGHKCKPRPNSVQQGVGICPKCAGKIWDVFYLLGNPVREEVKLGITSGNPKSRLSDHKRDGFTDFYGVWTNFPGAAELERQMKRALPAAGFLPVRGQEYFRIDALPFIQSLCPGDRYVRS